MATPINFSPFSLPGALLNTRKKPTTPRVTSPSLFGGTQTSTPQVKTSAFSLPNLASNLGLGRTGSTTDRKPLVTPVNPSLFSSPTPPTFGPVQPTTPITTGGTIAPTGGTAPSVTPPAPPRTPSGLTLEEALAKQSANQITQPPQQTQQEAPSAPTAPTAPPIPPETTTAVASAEAAFIESQKLSPEALSTSEDLSKLIESTKKAFLDIKDQPIPLAFHTGQLASVERRSLALAQPLADKLARLQAKRTASIGASKFALERADRAADIAREGVGDVKTDIIETGGRQVLINTQTGEHIRDLGPIQEEGKETAVADFSLSPGQIRFDSDGNVIARGGAKPLSDTAIAKAAETAEAKTEAQFTQTETIGLVNAILANPNLGTISGKSRFGIGARTAGTADIKSSALQLKALTSLEGRSKLRGSGTISDFEAQMLSASANALNFAIQEDGRIAMSDEDVEQNLKNIRGVLLTKSGQTVDVIATDPATGESELFKGVTRQEIADATLNGLIINYQ